MDGMHVGFFIEDAHVNCPVQCEHGGMKELQLHTLNVYRFILQSKKALSQSPFLIFSGMLPFGSASCMETSAIPKFSFIKAYDAILVTAAGSLHDWTLSRPASRSRELRYGLCSASGKGHETESMI